MLKSRIMFFDELSLAFHLKLQTSFSLKDLNESEKTLYFCQSRIYTYP